MNFLKTNPLFNACFKFLMFEKPDGKCLVTFVVDEFSELFLHLSVFPIIHSISP